jgi:hypothetical protein
MARVTRNSNVLDKAMMRAAGMQSIEENLNFGEGLSLATYDAQIKDLQTQLYDYNTLLAELDTRAAAITAAEAGLSRLSDKMLASVRIRYGNTSLEYGIAGGTIRKSRSRSRPADPATPTIAIAAPVETESAITNGKGVAIALN